MEEASRIPSSFARGYSPVLRKLLWTRGYQAEEAVDAFLNPSLSQLPTPIDSLLDHREAIQILLKARERKDRVVVYGDYDVDGTTSTALLVSILKEWGWNIGYFIPHRIREGYGVTAAGVESMLSREADCKVVITCDCGIASHEGIAILKNKGIGVVVTDHHEVPATRVSADAVLNPKQLDCNYPFKKLAGVGVAFLLIVGLRRALELRDYALAPWLDLVAIGTVCDCAELVGANRALVSLGLDRVRTSSRLGIQALLNQVNLKNSRKMKSQDLGFLIGPRLNAAGRVGEPDLGIRTLLADTPGEAAFLVGQLEEQNSLRRRMQDEQVARAIAMAEEAFRKAPTQKGVIVSDSSFHLGVVGLVASKLVERFERPACVLAKLDDEHELANLTGGVSANTLWKGSLRAPGGYHLAAALEKLKELNPSLLKSAGGHALAAGVAMEDSSQAEFRHLFELAMSEQAESKVSVSGVEELEWDHFEPAMLLEALDAFEPFGIGNPPFMCRVNSFSIERVQRMKEIHVKLWGKPRRSSGAAFSVLQFKTPYVTLWQSLERGGVADIDFLAEVAENEWNGKRSLELRLKQLLQVRVDGQVKQIHFDAIEQSRQSDASREGESLRQAKGRSNSDSAQSGRGKSKRPLPV